MPALKSSENSASRKAGFQLARPLTVSESN
jgi:hypothetical protein